MRSMRRGLLYDESDEEGIFFRITLFLRLYHITSLTFCQILLEIFTTYFADLQMCKNAGSIYYPLQQQAIVLIV